MPLALEYMIRARVLVLKFYGQIAVAELRGTPEKIAAHGCYFPGLPILIELAEWPAERLENDIRKLLSALDEHFPRSRVALAWDASIAWPPESPNNPHLKAFSSRAEALAWLVALPGD
jgi:hypothetical protein